MTQDIQGILRMFANTTNGLVETQSPNIRSLEKQLLITSWMINRQKCYRAELKSVIKIVQAYQAEQSANS